MLPRFSPPNTSVIFRQKEFRVGSVWIQSHMSCGKSEREERPIISGIPGPSVTGKRGKRSWF